jgi:hypothetical protein
MDILRTVIKWNYENTRDFSFHVFDLKCHRPFDIYNMPKILNNSHTMVVKNNSICGVGTLGILEFKSSSLIEY